MNDLGGRIAPGNRRVSARAALIVLDRQRWGRPASLILERTSLSCLAASMALRRASLRLAAAVDASSMSYFSVRRHRCLARHRPPTDDHLCRSHPHARPADRHGCVSARTRDSEIANGRVFTLPRFRRLASAVPVPYTSRPRGAVAQLGERRVRNAKVEGSIPFRSTTNGKGAERRFFYLGLSDLLRRPGCGSPGGPCGLRALGHPKLWVGHQPSLSLNPCN